MNYVFFGSPKFAEIILNKLIISGFVPTAVVCNPDRPIGRKKVLTPPLTKILAQKHNIPVIQFEKLDIGDWKLEMGKIKNINFDFFIVAAYSKIIPKEIINIPKLGVIGVHPSLLPKYRGATPIQSVILNGEKETGATLFLIDEKVDHGPILAQQKLEFSLSNFQFLTLLQKLGELSADLLIKTLPKFINGEIKPQEQNHNEATFTKKITTQDGFVRPEDLDEAQTKGGQKAVEIERKIRALNPDPGVWTLGLKSLVSPAGRPLKMPENKRIKLLEGRLSPTGSLILTKIQIEGKRPFVIKT